MSGKVTKTTRQKYTAKFKFTVALEAEKTDELTKTARKYGINSTMLSKWKKDLMDNGSEIFKTTRDKENDRLRREIANLERMVGKKEVELNLLKNFSDFYTSPNTT